MVKRAACRGSTRAALLCALAFVIVFLTVADALAVTSGSRVWARRYQLTPPWLEGGWSAVGRDGAVHICGARVVQSSPLTIAPYVVTFGSGGDRRWFWEESFPGYPAAAVTDIAVDRYGNVYACGSLMFTASDQDLLLVKLSPDGQVLWTRSWEPSPGRWEVGFALAVSPGGAAYVAGFAQSDVGQGLDYLFARWSRDGVLSWVRTYDAETKDDAATDIALDGAGGLVVTGTIHDAEGDQDCETLRLTAATGDWATLHPVQRYTGAAGGEEDDPRLACGPDGAAYVALESDGGAATGTDIILLKYRADGKRSWTRRYDGPGHLDERLWSLAVDRDGNAFVAGTARHLHAPDESALALRYSPAGRRVWARLYRQSSSGRSAQYADVALDGLQRPCFGGTLGTDAGADIVLAAYDRDGTLRWRRIYDGPHHLSDGVVSLATYGTTALYVSGGTQVGASDYHGLVLKYRL